MMIIEGKFFKNVSEEAAEAGAELGRQWQEFILFFIF